MPKTKNIILIGFMGAGKDTVGLALSSRTGLKFISTDDYIALRENSPVARIIKIRGEHHFRKLEHQALLGIRHLNNIILATGGGIAIDPRNRKILKRMGTVFHLDVSAKNAAWRLKNDNRRPLISNRTSILDIHQKRQGMYEFADHRLDTNRHLPGGIARRIISILQLKASPKKPASERITIKAASRSYPVFIGPHLTRDHRSILKKIIGPVRQAVIVTNPLIGAIFLSDVRMIFDELRIETDVMTIPDGEMHKSLKTVLSIIDFFMDHRMSRSDLAVALGGGVIGDITALAASLYKRGVPYLQVPTTLLAQVDAAIGGKTGINHRCGKNMIGTFYQPRAVFCDPGMLATLGDRDYSNGIAEAIKYGIIADARLFRLLERDSDKVKEREGSTLHQIIMRCLTIKKGVVESDEREEKGLREILNFGHTLGHVLETLMGYAAYPHGEAVSIGMALESRTARDLRILDERDYRRIIRLLKLYELPVALPAIGAKKDMLGALVHDKKIRNGKIRLPVPVRIGKIAMKEVACEKLL